MLVKHSSDVPAEPMNKPGFSGMTARFVLTSGDGCPRYALRLMEWTTGGQTSYHQHKEEHEMYVLEGEGIAIGNDKKEVRLRPGDALYFAPCEFHQIRNVGSSVLRIICTVPIFPGMEGKTTTPCE